MAVDIIVVVDSTARMCQYRSCKIEWLAAVVEWHAYCKVHVTRMCCRFLVLKSAYAKPEMPSGMPVCSYMYTRMDSSFYTFKENMAKLAIFQDDSPFTDISMQSNHDGCHDIKIPCCCYGPL